MSKIFGVKIVSREWVPEGDMAFIYNGVDNIVRLDGTNKEVQYEVKKPKMVVFHAGETRNLKDLQANGKLKRELALQALPKRTKHSK